MLRLKSIDSHTGGEPTRVILDGQIDVKGLTMAERLQDFKGRLDHLRAGVVTEPRGSDVLVGALLTPAVHEDSASGVIFFNDVGYLGMCGHGTIGVVQTLRYLGAIKEGAVRLDTPVGTVSATLLSDGWVELQNVKSRVKQLDVKVEVPGLGTVTGDVAYGGNWFYIVRSPYFDISMSKVAELTTACWKIRKALAQAGITGDDGVEIDHVELFSETPPRGADSQNFVQCPGGAYDRSPCGTGTSAKLACLYARGEIKEGQEYIQASVAGSVFHGSVKACEGGVIPTIRGQAFVTGESTLLFNECDPFKWGLS